jgi:hypothetical protein
MGTFRGKFYLARGGEDQQKIENGVEAPTLAVDATFHAITAVLALGLCAAKAHTNLLKRRSSTFPDKVPRRRVVRISKPSHSARVNERWKIDLTCSPSPESRQ